jgi:hypothetical protein
VSITNAVNQDDPYVYLSEESRFKIIVESLKNDDVLNKCFVEQETKTFPVISEKMKKFAVVVSKAEFIYGEEEAKALATATTAEEFHTIYDIPYASKPILILGGDNAFESIVGWGDPYTILEKIDILGVTSTSRPKPDFKEDWKQKEISIYYDDKSGNNWNKGDKVALGEVLASRDKGKKKSNTLRKKIQEINELQLTDESEASSTALRKAIKTTDSIKEYTTLDKQTLIDYYKEDNPHTFFQYWYKIIRGNHGGRKNKTRKKQKGKKRKSIKQKKQKPLKDV